MDEARRRELRALKSKLFFELMTQVTGQFRDISAILSTMKEKAKSDNPLSQQEFTAYCDATELILGEHYTVWETHTGLIYQIIEQFKNEDDDNLTVN